MKKTNQKVFSFFFLFKTGGFINSMNFTHPPQLRICSGEAIRKMSKDFSVSCLQVHVPVKREQQIQCWLLCNHATKCLFIKQKVHFLHRYHKIIFFSPQGKPALCHFQMLSYCGTDSVPSWHPQADVSLHSIVCTHFALSKSLFKQFWGSKKCFISFSVLYIFVFEEKQRTIISFSFNSRFTDKPLFISQPSMQFYSKTVREVKFSLHKTAINNHIEQCMFKTP